MTADEIDELALAHGVKILLDSEGSWSVRLRAAIDATQRENWRLTSGDRERRMRLHVVPEAK